MRFDRVLKGVVADAIKKVKKKVSDEEIDTVLDDPRVKKRLAQFQGDVTDLGHQLPEPSNGDQSDKQATRKGIGALQKSIVSSFKNWQLIRFLLKGGLVLAILVLLHGLLYFAPKTAKKFRTDTPELYCAFVYWLNDTPSPGTRNICFANEDSGNPLQ